MPLFLSRKAGQKLVITLAPDADPQECLRALRADGIEITVTDIGARGAQVRLMVDAPRELLVLREELASEGLLCKETSSCSTSTAPLHNTISKEKCTNDRY